MVRFGTAPDAAIKMKKTILFTSSLKPTCFDDLCLSDDNINALRKMYETDNLMNLIFYGRTGVGKTSAALLLASERTSFHINGSAFNKDYYDELIKGLSAVSFDGYLKRIIIDEADSMTHSSQERLRYDIEKYCSADGSSRFVMTTNDVSGLSDAIRSRCYAICFDPVRSEYDSIVERLIHRYQVKLADYRIPEAVIRTAIRNCFPDMRRIANELQMSHLKAA